MTPSPPWRAPARILTALLSTFVLASCSGDEGANPVDPLGRADLSILTGAGTTDTILARPVQGLVVRVLGDDGEPEDGVSVTFASEDRSMLVAAVTDQGFAYSAVTDTDAEGRATVRVRFGDEAGPAAIRIEVPLYGLVDSASYTVLPGAPSTVRIEPRDTTVTLESRWTIRAAVVDRMGNPRDEPVTLEADPDLFDLQGKDVTPLGVGRGMIKVRVTLPQIEEELRDSVWASVVPEGALALTPYRQPVHVGDLTGTSAPVGSLEAIMPSWALGGSSIVFVNGGKLFLNDLNGGDEPLPTPDVASIGWPVFSPDGAWIYFQGKGPPRDPGIYRVRPDGSSLARVTPEAERGQSPTLSPDGRLLAYLRGNEVVVRDLSDGSSRTIHQADAGLIRWSPAGDWIAVVGRRYGELVLVRPDGSQAHQVGSHGIYADSGFTWSPDGRWIVGFEGATTLVDVEAETMMELSWGGRRSSPGVSWRR